MKAEKVLSEPGLKSVAGTALLGNLTQNTKQFLQQNKLGYIETVE